MKKLQQIFDNINDIWNTPDLRSKKCAEECEIICLKFTEWTRNHSWEHEYRDQKTYTDKQLFNIFINNYLK